MPRALALYPSATQRNAMVSATSTSSESRKLLSQLSAAGAPWHPRFRPRPTNQRGTGFKSHPAAATSPTGSCPRGGESPRRGFALLTSWDVAGAREHRRPRQPLPLQQSQGVLQA